MLANEHAVGFYTAAIKLAKISIPIIISIGAVLVPQLAKNFSTRNIPEVQQLLTKSFRFISFSSVPITFGLALLAPEFIFIFSGEKFLPAITCMQILALLPLVISLGYFFAFQILVPAGKSKEVFIAAVAGVGTGLVLNFILIPFYQETGAAIANVICELLVLVFYIYFAFKNFQLQYQWSLLIQSTISSIIFIPAVWFIRMIHLNHILTLILSIGSCFLLYSMVQTYLFKNQFLETVRVYLFSNHKKSE
jgi:O-antigen/teichoic acid export membrane protein